RCEATDKPCGSDAGLARLRLRLVRDLLQDVQLLAPLAEKAAAFGLAQMAATERYMAARTGAFAVGQPVLAQDVRLLPDQKLAAVDPHLLYQLAQFSGRQRADPGQRVQANPE